MKYQKIIKFLDNKPNQPTKSTTKVWIETNDEARGTNNKDVSQACNC